MAIIRANKPITITSATNSKTSSGTYNNTLGLVEPSLNIDNMFVNEPLNVNPISSSSVSLENRQKLLGMKSISSDPKVTNAFNNLTPQEQIYYLENKGKNTSDKQINSNVSAIVDKMRADIDKNTTPSMWDKISSTVRKTAFGEDFQSQDYAKSTGSGTKDFFSNLIGTAAGFAVPSGSGGSAMTVMNKVGEKVAEKIAPKITTTIGNKVANPLLSKVLTGGAINTVRGAAEGLGGGVYENVVTPNMTIGDRAKSLATNTLLGAGIGGAIGGAAPIASKVGKSLKENINGYDPKELLNIIQNRETPTFNQTAPELYKVSNKTAKYTLPDINQSEFDNLKNTMVKKYSNSYDNTIKDIQNKVGNYELNAADEIKHADLIQKAKDDLQKVEYYQNLTPDKLKNKISAGVIEPEEMQFIDKVKQYSDSKALMPKKLQPLNVAEKPTFNTEFSGELTPQIKSNRQLPKTLSDAEFDKYYNLDQTPNKAAVNNMVEDIGARVINKYGTDNIPTLVKKYVDKYNLPDNVKVNFTLKNSSNKATTQPIRDLNGNITGAKININPNQSIEGKIGSLRHEIEHYKDLVEGYGEATNKYKFNPKVDKTGKDLYTNASKGHHKNYGWFEYDYLKKAIQEDGLQPTESIVQPQKEVSNIINQSDINMPQNVNKTVSNAEYMKPLDEPRITKSDIPTEGQKSKYGFEKNVATDENMDDSLRDYASNNQKERNRLENVKLEEYANRRINEPLENLVTEFKTKTNFKPEDVPLARLIANKAAKNGDLKTANEIVSRIAEKLTESGQFSQAAKVLRKSNPAALMEYLQRTVIKLNEKGAEKFGAKWKSINLSEQVQKEIYNLKLFDEAAIEKAMNNAYDDINSQLPTTTLEKIDSWRRMAMLLNPKTHIRNVVGNAMMMGLRGTQETLSTLAESIFLKNKPELRTKSFGYKRNSDIVKAVNDTWNNLQSDLIEGSGRYDIEQALNVGNREKRIFNNNVLEKINVKSKEWLNKGDEIFMQKAFKDSLGGYIKAKNLTEATPEAIAYATNKAEEATYRQYNAFANWLNSAKRKGGVFGKAVDIMVPFVKTPANIAKTAYEYSPMGLLNLFKKSKSASEVIDTITKGLTGSAVLGVGYFLADSGLARTASTNSKNAEALNQMEGQNYNSIITPWGSYSFDWASPLAIPLAMGMSIREGFDKKNVSNNWIDKFTKTLYNTGNASLDSFVNMSMLQGIKDAIGGYGSTMDKIAKIPSNVLSQMIPTLSNQAARTIDPVERNTYDPNPLKQTGKTMLNKIPGASMLLEPKIDTLGEVKSQNDNIGIRAANNFISPGKFLGKNDNPNIKEISRLYDKNKDTGILPKVAPKSFKVDGQEFLLTPKELTQFQKTMGENESKGLQRTLSKGNDKTKEKALKQLADDSYNKAKLELLKNRGIKTSIKKVTFSSKSIQIKP